MVSPSLVSLCLGVPLFRSDILLRSWNYSGFQGLLYFCAAESLKFHSIGHFSKMSNRKSFKLVLAARLRLQLILGFVFPLSFPLRDQNYTKCVSSWPLPCSLIKKLCRSKELCKYCKILDVERKLYTLSTVLMHPWRKGLG